MHVIDASFFTSFSIFTFQLFNELVIFYIFISLTQKLNIGFLYKLIVLKINGLGSSYWKEVIDVLRNIIPVYDKVNSVVSLGKDDAFRKEGVVKSVRSGNVILDAGSGFGNMSKTVLDNVSRDVAIFFYDPIYEMLHKVKDDGNIHTQPFRFYLCSGIFENIPFKSNTFDAVLCGYSLRDAIDLDLAIGELHRVLKKDGRLVIVDLGKPDNVILRILVSLYLKYFLAILAFSVAGKQGIPFRTLYGTFLRWPKNNELYNLLSKSFSKIDFKKKFLGGAIVVVAYK
jgi:demethylmenaquinone methyltransferase / 2-methoxy-6-polyprenyl-1,4-benzoquinol methylase